VSSPSPKPVASAKAPHAELGPASGQTSGSFRNTGQKVMKAPHTMTGGRRRGPQGDSTGRTWVVWRAFDDSVDGVDVLITTTPAAIIGPLP